MHATTALNGQAGWLHGLPGVFNGDGIVSPREASCMAMITSLIGQFLRGSALVFFVQLRRTGNWTCSVGRF